MAGVRGDARATPALLQLARRSGNLSTSWRDPTGMTPMAAGGCGDSRSGSAAAGARRGGWVVGADGRIEKRSGTRASGGNAPPGDNWAGCSRKRFAMRRDQPRTREPSAANALTPAIRAWHGQTREPGGQEPEFHLMTMPELFDWMQFPVGTVAPRPHPQRSWSAPRLSGVLQDLPVRQGGTKWAYSSTRPTATRCGRAVCTRKGPRARWANDGARMVRGQRGQPALPDRPRRIRHRARGARGLGKRRLSSGSAADSKGGMATWSKGIQTQQHRERLWFPHCPGAKVTLQMDLFA